MARLLSHHVPLATLAEVIADVCLTLLALPLAARQLSSHPFAQHLGGDVGIASLLSALRVSRLLQPMAILALGMALIYAFAGLYRSGAINVSPRTKLGRAFFAVVVGCATLYGLLKAMGDDGFAFQLSIRVLPYLALAVFVVRGAVYIGRRVSFALPRVLIVGTGVEALKVAEDLLRGEGRSRGTVVGFYAPGEDASPVNGLRLPVFSRERPLKEIVAEHGVTEVIVAVREQRGGATPMDELLACRISGVPVIDLAGFSERSRREVPTDSLKASWLIYGEGFVQGPLRSAIKRIFDVLSSALLLVLAMPVMAITSLAIWVEGGGPLIYRQERVGLGGRIIVCPKFRSMRNDAERDGVARWATKNDSRVTRVGSFIRRTRIDELPQLFTVLRGEMSLVGPRPERPSFVEELCQQIPYYDLRHSVKPGVTGWAQVRYAYGASVEDARRKHQFDLYYIKHHSLLLDLLVLVETVSVVLFREGGQ